MRNKGVLDLISTRQALIGSRGQWCGSCHGHKRRTTQSPFSLSLILSCSLALLHSCTLALLFFLGRVRVSPVSSALLFVWFRHLSARGLSCKCSCWPPILVVLRSLPKSNKHSWSTSPSLSVCVHRGEPVVDLSFPFLPQNSTCFHLSPTSNFTYHQTFERSRLVVDST